MLNYRNLIYFCIVFFCLKYSQAKDKKTITDSVSFNVKTGKIIRAKITETKYNNVASFYDSINKQTVYITRKFRGKHYRNIGEIIATDINTDTVNWKVSTNKFRYLFYKNDLLVTRQLTSATMKGTTCFDLKTGNFKWSETYEVISKFDSIYFARRFMTPYDDHYVKAFSFTDPHHLKWNYHLENNLPFSISRGFNDTTVVISGKQFQLLNPQTGKGWKIEDKTTFKNTAEAISTGALVVVGALAGVLINPGNISIYDLHSNLAYDSNRVYYASLGNLFCLDYKGNKIWETKLNDDITSKSHLIVTKYDIILVNFGCGKKDNNYVKFGKPYIAVFDKEYGRESFIHIIDSKEIIESFSIDSNKVEILFNDKFLEFNIRKNKILTEKNFDTKIIGKLKSFHNNKLTATCLEKNDSIIDLLEAMPNRRFFRNTNYELLAFDSNYNFVQKVNSDLLYNLIDSIADFRIYYHNKHQIITNSKGITICNFADDGNVSFYNKKLYYKKGKQIAIIDLKNL